MSHAVLANAALDFAPLRALMSKMLGISAKRPLPHYAKQRFDKCFARRGQNSGRKARGKVILWDDTFVRYHEPHIGIAAVAVLEALDFEVALMKGRTCCGRPAFSQGNLAEARRLGKHNLDLLCSGNPDVPVIFLEPSCYSMFVEDYRELNFADAPTAARRHFSSRNLSTTSCATNQTRSGSKRSPARLRFTRIAMRSRS
jgi:Fe-S oxidoreductase